MDCLQQQQGDFGTLPTKKAKTKVYRPIMTTDKFVFRCQRMDPQHVVIALQEPLPVAFSAGTTPVSGVWPQFWDEMCSKALEKGTRLRTMMVLCKDDGSFEPVHPTVNVTVSEMAAMAGHKSRVHFMSNVSLGKDLLGIEKGCNMSSVSCCLA